MADTNLHAWLRRKLLTGEGADEAVAGLQREPLLAPGGGDVEDVLEVDEPVLEQAPQRPTLADVFAARERDASTQTLAGISQAGRNLSAAIAGVKPTRTMVQPGQAERQALGDLKLSEQAADRAARTASNKDAQMIQWLKLQQGSDAARATAAERELAEARAKKKLEQDADQFDKRLHNDNTQKALDRSAAEERARIMAAGANQRAALKADEGGRLPAGTASTLGDYDAAVAELDKVLESFNTNDMEGLKGRSGAFVTKLLGLGDTDSASYNATAKRGMQGVGTILEGGKLAAGDEHKYAEMLPKAGDSKELAAQKVEGLKAMLRTRFSSQKNALTGAGFKRVPDMKSSPGPAGGQQRSQPADGGVPQGNVTVRRKSDNKLIPVPADRVEAMREKGLIE